MEELEVIIGMEVHVQLKTASKVFCGCSTDFESPPNTNICPLCCGYPGVLPVLNEKAFRLAIRCCLALNCHINERVYFERKNYFYPDLPKNYQISQYKLPLGEDGFLTLTSGKRITIKRIHLEEDAGKLIHKENYSLVDFNRAGIPLLEIVSSPQINSPQEAFDYLTYLKLTLQYIGTSDCDMEKGSLRCDANISLKKKADTQLGTKVELKNMNTFRGVKEALEYEAKRQKELLLAGKKVLQETRLWDTQDRRTFTMRTKEEAHDYRYFPEPDLLDFLVLAEFIKEEKGFIKELPLEKRARFLKNYPLSEREVDTLIGNPYLANFFEEALTFYPHPKEIANWLLGPFLEQLNLLGGDHSKVRLSPKNFSLIVRYFKEGRLNNLAAKKILALSMQEARDVETVIKEEGLLQVSQEEDLLVFVKEAIQKNNKASQDYLAGRQEALMFLVGWIMKLTKGKANPKVVKELLERELKDGR